jgi:hypothetical protein
MATEAANPGRLPVALALTWLAEADTLAPTGKAHPLPRPKT